MSGFFFFFIFLFFYFFLFFLFFFFFFEVIHWSVHDSLLCCRLGRSKPVFKIPGSINRLFDLWYIIKRRELIRKVGSTSHMIAHGTSAILSCQRNIRWIAWLWRSESEGRRELQENSSKKIGLYFFFFFFFFFVLLNTKYLKVKNLYIYGSTFIELTIV